MISFKAPVDDILFCLEKVARADTLPGWDSVLAREILSHYGDFAEGVIAPIDETGDLQGCRLEEGRVKMPDGFQDAYAKIVEAGWQGLSVPESYGGMEVNHLIAAAVSEIFTGACQSMQMVCNLVPGAVATLLAYGSEAQKAEWIPRMAGGEVLATMCLTEPGAGSDLSRIRARATRDGDAWRLDGEKIFISGGDQDLTEDILHLVLARTGAPEDGVKGLSLFLCCAGNADRNRLTVTRIEEKMGLHASPTCQLAFDGSRAELIGQEGSGLAAMFTVMNHARIDVSLQGVAHAARSHQIAAAYAAERGQGRKADGSPAMLTDHADVRRMLDEQRSLALGARAMCLITLVEMEKGEQPALIDFLTPVCKVFCSEAGIRAADLGIQVLGGYGYLNEYRIGQRWRDARITAIYEGANGIHALALSTRGLRVGGGAGPDAFQAFIGALSDDPDVLAARDRWTEARARLEASDTPAEFAHDFMQMTAQLYYRAAWSRIADASAAADLKALNEKVQGRVPTLLSAPAA